MADVIAILFVAAVIPTVMYLLADVIAIFFLADVIAIVCMLLGWWQMLLPLWLLFCHSWLYCIILWQMLFPSLLADVIAMFVYCCVLLQLLLPLWLMVLPFVRLM